jgi:hypothetical protein
MYLYATKYISTYEFNPQEEREQCAQVLDILGATDYLTPQSPGVEIRVTVGYWRKSNQIHKWFVDHCQDGRDECQYTYIRREQLVELKDLCEQARATKDPTLLPNQEGFFFGSQEYDESYWEDLNDTVKMLTRILAQVPEDWEFGYRSSW